MNDRPSLDSMNYSKWFGIEHNCRRNVAVQLDFRKKFAQISDNLSQTLHNIWKIVIFCSRIDRDRLNCPFRSSVQHELFLQQNWFWILSHMSIWHEVTPHGESQIITSDDSIFIYTFLYRMRQIFARKFARLFLAVTHAIVFLPNLTYASSITSYEDSLTVSVHVSLPWPRNKK